MRLRLRLFLGVLVALAAVGCDRGNRTVLDVGADAGCAPMPTACPAEMQCQVVASGGERVCTGTACCQAFCEWNGCGQCCAQ